MRTIKLVTITMMFTAMLFSVNTNIFAQKGYGYGTGQGYGNGQSYFCNNIPNLTVDQQNKINELRTAHWKKVQSNHNLLAEKRARLQTLRTADNVDMNAINNTIDEISVIQTGMHKNKEQHFQNVRSILTADQRVYFDNFNKSNRYGQGYGRGRGNGYGQGYGRGRGNGYGRRAGQCRRNW